MKNLVILIGNLGGDPEVRYTQGGSAVASFTVATTEKYKDKQGNMQESVEWNKCVSYGKLAELAGEYLSKGSKVYIEGRLSTRKWQDKSGNDRYTTEVVVKEMKFLSPKSSSGQNHSGSSDGGYSNLYPMDGEDVPF